MAAKWAREAIIIPKEFGPEEREAIAEDVLKFIRRRTSKGLDKDNKRFPRYTEDYIKSLDFRNADKSSARVNLRLSGDMMAAMDLISHKPGKLNIGFEKGTEENARADGNIRGTYGQDRPDSKKKRDFLGIHPDDLQKILDRYGK